MASGHKVVGDQPTGISNMTEEVLGFAVPQLRMHATQQQPKRPKNGLDLSEWRS